MNFLSKLVKMHKKAKEKHIFSHLFPDYCLQETPNAL